MTLSGLFRRLPVFIGSLPAAAFVLGFSSEPLEAANLAPHRAVYSLKIGQARAGSSFVDARGAMTLIMEKSCDGWILEQTMTMDLSTAEGDTLKQKMNFSGLESLDGGNYRFAADNDIDEKKSQINGKARAGSDGKPGEVNYKLPEAKTISLPEKTLFPVGHTSWLIDRAIAGDRQAPSHVFDGADGGGPQEVVAFIGPLAAPEAVPSKDQLGALVKRPGWNVRLAFYQMDSQDAEPEYEAEIMQLDNGVARRMVLDYREFTVILELEKIEAINPPSC
ncbi:MAG: hypothetical protein A3G18_04130 [Rhodospirillales bacterium RIFCSPLOWO2_12_FULL_58_28]|nr:MAG: hypothetical protein A3H92_05010 [Rhodospirillales bacterium RIFCSPLOWO2_02_FULL_58_16]OHC78709.1 MAG: hypothetical protein A3G18_04130 [Rhodospirillales bacterium RIFCSPLOWO2_12_FULL_58_28]